MCWADGLEHHPYKSLCLYIKIIECIQLISVTAIFLHTKDDFKNENVGFGRPCFRISTFSFDQQK